MGSLPGHWPLDCWHSHDCWAARQGRHPGNLLVPHSRPVLCIVPLSSAHSACMGYLRPARLGWCCLSLLAGPLQPARQAGRAWLSKKKVGVLAQHMHVLISPAQPSSTVGAADGWHMRSAQGKASERLGNLQMLNRW